MCTWSLSHLLCLRLPGVPELLVHVLPVRGVVLPLAPLGASSLAAALWTHTILDIRNQAISSQPVGLYFRMPALYMPDRPWLCPGASSCAWRGASRTLSAAGPPSREPDPLPSNHHHDQRLRA